MEIFRFTCVIMGTRYHSWQPNINKYFRIQHVCVTNIYLPSKMKVGRTTHTNETFNIVLDRERFVLQINLISPLQTSK